ncbi:TIR domain-containing protein [Paraclostridium bifermentans]|uniref:TIR domain-containing protein n=1 Tax=Paraclostridium bifermentans TaxID=1490 RepID=UPI003D2B7132
MTKKKVCISFDYTNDKHYRHLLSAWDANSDFEFRFTDFTPSEINSEDYSRVKAVITQKIKASTYLLVIVGKYANENHPREKEIGDKNWLNWEINKAKELGKKLIAVKIDKSYESPTALLNCRAEWAMNFSQDSIINALNKAQNK